MLAKNKRTKRRECTVERNWSKSGRPGPGPKIASTSRLSGLKSPSPDSHTPAKAQLLLLKLPHHLRSRAWFLKPKNRKGSGTEWTAELWRTRALGGSLKRPNPAAFPPFPCRGGATQPPARASGTASKHDCPYSVQHCVQYTEYTNSHGSKARRRWGIEDACHRGNAPEAQPLAPG